MLERIVETDAPQSLRDRLDAHTTQLCRLSRMLNAAGVLLTAMERWPSAEDASGGEDEIAALAEVVAQARDMCRAATDEADALATEVNG